jgi:hypothetical protein
VHDAQAVINLSGGSPGELKMHLAAPPSKHCRQAVSVYLRTEMQSSSRVAELDQDAKFVDLDIRRTEAGPEPVAVMTELLGQPTRAVQVFASRTTIAPAGAYHSEQEEQQADDRPDLGPLVPCHGPQLVGRRHCHVFGVIYPLGSQEGASDLVLGDRRHGRPVGFPRIVDGSIRSQQGRAMIAQLGSELRGDKVGGRIRRWWWRATLRHDKGHQPAGGLVLSALVMAMRFDGDRRHVDVAIGRTRATKHRPSQITD